ncbi:HlyD family efflux transporter periplasmic adaptor subunit [Oscillatoria sp. HE19RPO]|uniref:HlyD family efflux transporter periplasmic adaptor subunit n=1 Tax=Oscillatoria sp. HE19RPO TaxID=2954806 RepID=UPI0020C4C4A9|nr:HlyD family efflux transporter periplasmic adaptor subunit [Oscillatoria sp. HE19RPO]
MLSDPNQNLLPIAKSDEFLPPLSGWNTLGGLFLVGTVAAAVTMAAIAEYPITVKVPATIRLTGEVKIVQAAVEGTIQRIEVRENQEISQGSAIAILDDSQLQIQKVQTQNNLQNIQQQIAQINAQIQAIDGQMMAETERSNRTVASGKSELSRQQRDYQDRQVNTVLEVEEALANLRVIEQELAQAQSEMKAELATLYQLISSVDTGLFQASQYRMEFNENIDLRTLSKQQFEQIAQESPVESAANVRKERENLSQMQSELRSAQADLTGIERALAAAELKRDRHQTLLETGAISRQVFEEFQLLFDQQTQALAAQIARIESYQTGMKQQEQVIAGAEARLQNELAEVQLIVEQQKQAVAAQKARVETQKQAIAREEQAVAAAQAKVQRARTALNPNDSQVAIAREQIEGDQATGLLRIAELTQQRAALIQQKIDQENQGKFLEQELEQIQRQIQQKVIEAPESGKILQINLRNPGQVVRIGEEIAQISPIQAPLVVKAWVPSSEISQVETGQKVYLRIAACPHPEYGMLTGKVSAISPDTISLDNRTVNSSLNQPDLNSSVATSSYEVMIELQQFYLTRKSRIGANFSDSSPVNSGERDDQHCSLQPGMQARADIVSKTATFLNFILRTSRIKLAN